MAEYTIVQVKRDSTLNWYASNPRLALGEPGVDMDLHRFKIGNGIDRWNELPYMDDDLYKLLDEQEQATADYVQDLLNKIAANKLDADQKYNSLTTELRNTSRTLGDRMTAVETGQAEYQEELTERQQEFEEAVTGDFEDTKAEVQAGLDEFNQTRDRLNIRMDAIAGQTTEDTEILDARVDAEYRAHANLGANIRNIHSQLLTAEQARAESTSEIESEIAGLKTADQTETAERISADEAHDEELADLQAKTRRLSEHGEFLQEQITDNASGWLDTTLQIYGIRADALEESVRLDTEIQARETGDFELSTELEQERTERANTDASLSESIRTQGEELRRADAEIDAELKHERRSRTEETQGLATQVDRLAEGVADGHILLESEAEKLREEIAGRAQAENSLSRIHSRREDFLQEQAAETASEVISLNLRLNEEQNTRRETDTRHDTQISELGRKIENTRDTLSNETAELKRQTDRVSDAVIDAAGEIFRERENRTKADEELAGWNKHTDARTSELGEFLQAQIHETASQVIDTSIKLHEEIQGRKQADKEQSIAREDLQAQTDELSRAVTAGSLYSFEEHTRRKQAEENLEAWTDHLDIQHTKREDFLQEQANELAGEVLRLGLRDRELRQDLRREELARKVFDSSIEEEIAPLAEGLIREGIDRYEEHCRLEDKLKHEQDNSRISNEHLKEQINDTASASLQTSLNLQQENSRIRKDLALNTEQLNTERQERKEDVELERQKRITSEKFILENLDSLSAASLQQILSLARQAEKHKNDTEALKTSGTAALSIHTRNEKGIQEQVNELSYMMMSLLFSHYRAREKIDARFRAIEQALIDGGFLDDDDIQPATDTAIEDMIEDIFSGNTSGAIVPDDEDEAEFLEDINSIFYP